MTRWAMLHAVRRLMRRPVHIWIGEENAYARELAGYLVELARHLDAHPAKMRLKIESSVPAAIDIDPKDGKMVAEVRGERVKFDIRRRWLPEHPVPLSIGPAGNAKRRRTVLLIDPIDGNRFRVGTGRTGGVSRPLCALFAVVATAAVVTLHPVAILLSSLLLAALLLQMADH